MYGDRDMSALKASVATTRRPSAWMQRPSPGTTVFSSAVIVLVVWACTTPASGVPGEPCREQRESQTVDVSHRYHFADGSVYETSTGEAQRECTMCSHATNCLICTRTARLECMTLDDAGQVLVTCTETTTCPP